MMSMIDAKSRSMSRAAASRLRIDGGRVLVGDRFETTNVDLDDGLIRDVGRDGGARRTLDADGLMVLPGIIDIHGDAFERQMMPRPGVHFPLDVALLDTDRQVIANGITTVFHGVTWSWEPGLRGPENARALVAAIEALRPQLAADTRFHLRHETYNLDAEAEVMEWVDAGRVGMLAFNNHVPDLDSSRPTKISQMAERCGLSLDRFTALVRRVTGRADEVPDSIQRLAARGRAHAVPHAVARRCDPGGAAPVPRARMPRRRIPDHHRDGAGGRGGGRRDRARRAQCGARRQPHRVDQCGRHDRARPVLGPGVGLLLPGADARGLPARRRRGRSARQGLVADLRAAGARRGPAGPRRHRARTPRRCRYWSMRRRRDLGSWR